MKKYGQAELMIALVQLYLERKNRTLSEEEKAKLFKQVTEEILINYPSSRDLEVI